MSQTHSHGPGQPTHSHGPPPAGMQQQQQPKQVVPTPDPVMQAVIEASFSPVDIALGPPENVSALCQAHSQEKCAECDVDFSSLNRISRLLLMNPNLRCPPPPQMLTQKLTQAVTAMKEEGNVSALVAAARFDLTMVSTRNSSRKANIRSLSRDTVWLSALPFNGLPGKRPVSCEMSSPWFSPIVQLPTSRWATTSVRS